MSAEIMPLYCRYVRKMIHILSEAPDAVSGGADDSVFQRLVKLEQEAKEGGAPEASLRVIAYVRETTWAFVVFSAMGLNAASPGEPHPAAGRRGRVPEVGPGSRARLLGLS